MVDKLFTVCFLLAAVSLYVPASVALQLPSYIIPCARDDPQLNACALKNARKALPHFINGDKKYNVPPLEPFKIPELRVNPDGDNQAVGFSVLIKNCTVYGVKNVHIDDIKFDFKTKHAEYYLRFPLLETISTYNITGRILILPIFGNGLSNITFENVKMIYSYDFDQVMKNGLTYIAPKNSHVDLNFGQANIHLENLFNGDKMLGDNMNMFLNENWREVVDDVGPAFTQALAELMGNIFSGVFGLVSVEEGFI